MHKVARIYVAAWIVTVIGNPGVSNKSFAKNILQSFIVAFMLLTVSAIKLKENGLPEGFILGFELFPS